MNLTWEPGAFLLLHAYHCTPGKGLRYPAGAVRAVDGGRAGGWDVYDATTEAGEEISFYGFSVYGVTTSDGFQGER